MGFGGSSTAFRGRPRDYLLGLRMLNGEGQILHFGGQVMKNVAGYDLSRLQVGARGGLGVMLDVSLRVLPRPEEALYLAFERPEFISAISMVDALIAAAEPVSGATWHNGSLQLRFEGYGRSVSRLQRDLGGTQSKAD